MADDRAFRIFSADDPRAFRVQIVNAAGYFTIPDVQGLQDALDLKANDAAVVHLTGNESINGVKSLLSPPILPNGTAAAVAARNANNANTGIYWPTNTTFGVSVGGTQIWSATSGAMTVSRVFSALACFQMQGTNIGASLALSTTTTPAILDVSLATCNIVLPQRAWSAVPAFFWIRDTLGLLGGGGLTISAYDDGTGNFNSINGGHPTLGVWNDALTGTTGPYDPTGTVTLTRPYGNWILRGARLPDGSGAFGGWDLFATDPIGY